MDIEWKIFQMGCLRSGTDKKKGMLGVRSAGTEGCWE